MPPAWQQALSEKHGEVQGAILAAHAQARYEAFYNERPRFTHPALRWHLEQNILPGLALYQALREEYTNRDAALTETGSLLAIGATSKALNDLMNMRVSPPAVRHIQVDSQRIASGLSAAGMGHRATRG